MGDRSPAARIIHDDATAAQLAVIRIAVYSAWLFVLVRDPLYLLAEMPIDLFEPYGVIRFVPSGLWPYILDDTVLKIFKGVLVTSIFIALLGVKGARAAAAVAAICLTFHQAMVRGYAHINHAQLGILYASWVLALYPSMDAFSLRRKPTEAELQSRQRSYAMALQFMCIIVILAYTAIGLYRAVKSSPEIFVSNTMAYSIAKNTFRPSYFGFELGAWALKEPLLYAQINFGYALVTVMEVLSCLTLMHRRFRWLWLAVMFVFHCMTLLTMNLFFWHNLMLLLLLFTDIKPLLAKLGVKGQGGAEAVPAPA